MIQKVREWLKINKREEVIVEQGLFLIAMNTYHVLSLLWEKTTRKYTNEFLIFKAQEIVEILTSILPEDVDSFLVQSRMDDGYNVAKENCSSVENIIELIGVDFDNYPGSRYGMPADFKIGILLYALEMKGINKELIIKKYESEN